MRSIVLSVGFALVLALPAFAQTNNGNQNSSPATGSISPQDQNQSAQDQNESANIRQQVQQNLSKAGYTDIKIMPESFLVRAKDPSGNQIMMVINPDSIAAVTFAPRNTSGLNGTANSTSGSRSNR